MNKIVKCAVVLALSTIAPDVASAQDNGPVQAAMTATQDDCAPFGDRKGSGMGFCVIKEH